jgi:methionine-rich copper-binding protein CopC
VTSATHRILAAGLASAASLLALGIAATPAYAHAKLLKSDPATGAMVTAPIASVTLTFNEPVKQQSTVVTVAGADGASYSDSAARVVDSNVIQAVRALPAGAVSVSWKTVSADGDPIQGEFTFGVAPSAVPTTAPPTSASPEAAPQPEKQPGKQPGKTSMSWVWPSVTGAVVVGALALGLLWRRRRADTPPRS